MFKAPENISIVYRKLHDGEIDGVNLTAEEVSTILDYIDFLLLKQGMPANG